MDVNKIDQRTLSCLGPEKDIKFIHRLLFYSKPVVLTNKRPFVQTPSDQVKDESEDNVSEMNMLG